MRPVQGRNSVNTIAGASPSYRTSTSYEVYNASKQNTRGSRRRTTKRSSLRRNDAMLLGNNIPKLTNGGFEFFGFPPKIQTTLRYCDIYNITSSSGSLAKQLLNLNSIYDPDNSGVGHQPLYRDTFADIYNSYAVINARVKITFTSNASTSSMIVGAVIDDDSTTSSTITTLLEQGTGKHIFLPAVTGSLSNKSIYFTWNCKKFLGIDPFTSQTYKTNVSVNPSELQTLLVYAAPADGVSTTTTSLLVEMEFDVLFTELKTPTGS